MSKIFLIIFLSLAVQSYSQQLPQEQPIPSTQYLKKSKRQRFFGHVLLWGGLASAMYGALYSFGAGYNGPNPSANNAIRTYGLIGAASMVASAPLFIASKRNKRAALKTTAAIQLNNIPQAFSPTGAVTQTGVTVKLEF